MSECDQQRADIDRCRREIAALEAEILAGNPDLRGLCLALADWSGELRLLQEANEATETPHLAPVCADLPEVGPCEATRHRRARRGRRVARPGPFGALPASQPRHMALVLAPTR